MNYSIKGITHYDTIPILAKLGVNYFTFDLRPRSFNFVQIRKIEEIISQNPEVKNFGLLFENENPIVVKELLEKASKALLEQQALKLEFSGGESLEELEKFEYDYVWHYHEGERIKNIASTHYLKRIVFQHSLLEKYHQAGELYGFFGLFEEFVSKLQFEVQLDWDSELILSLFDFFQIPFLSFEINNKVELSYQNPNHSLIQNNLINIDQLFQSI